MYNRKKNMIFAIIAAIAGFFYSIADYLLEYLPHASTVLDKYGVVESAWADMSNGRFVASLVMAAILTPFFVTGYICIYRQIKESAPRLSKVFVITALIGGLADFFIHAILSIMPVVYKSVLESGNEHQAVAVLEKMTGSFIVPFYGYFAFIFAGYVLWFVYAYSSKSIYPKTYPTILLAAVVIQLVFAGFGVQVLSIGAFSRLEMMFFICAAVTEKKMDHLAAGD